MSGRIDPAVWAERQDWIHKQLDSGFSVARFCREHGLHVGNFHAWKLKLSKDSQGAEVNRNGAAQRPVRSSLAFVQLPRPAASSANASHAWVEISKADGLIVRRGYLSMRCQPTCVRALMAYAASSKATFRETFLMAIISSSSIEFSTAARYCFGIATD